jgi:hypothetical protein
MSVRLKQKLSEIQGFPLMKAVGLPLPDSVIAVANWMSAGRECKRKPWQRARLMARNRLQTLTEQCDWKRSEEWDAFIVEVRPKAFEMAKDSLRNSTLSAETLLSVANEITWDFLGICLEAEYSDLFDPVFFIPQLERWYQSGHFPCGWEGVDFQDGWNGEMPYGKFHIY